jgi:hypothetical protein
VQLWESALPKACRAPDVQLDSLARAFNLTPGEITRSAEEAKAIAQRDQHRMEAGKARDEAIAKHRADLQKAMEAKDLTHALIAAANLKFLLDAKEWNAELATPMVKDMAAKADARRIEAEKATDWLLAQEMLFRLRALLLLPFLLLPPVLSLPKKIE